MLGTNGGGFFNANSAHPFENPNPLTNFVQMVLIFSIGAALTNVFGRMVGSQRQGWAIFAVMGCCSSPASRRLSGGGAGQPGNSPRSMSTRRRPSCRPAATWKARRCASASPIRAVHDGDDRRVVRRGQQHARQPDAARRHGADGQHHARRDHLRRRRLWALRDAAVRRLAVFIAGLMVGRTPNISARRSRRRRSRWRCSPSWPAAVDPRLHRARAVLPDGLAGPDQSWAARLQRDPLCLRFGDRQQRQRLRRPHREHASTTPRSASRCSSAVS
jgi:hypothetical protein